LYIILPEERVFEAIGRFVAEPANGEKSAGHFDDQQRIAAASGNGGASEGA